MIDDGGCSGAVEGLPDPMPPPNLRGNYEGGCVVCLRGTDTGIGVAGTALFVAAALHVLGVPRADAWLMVQMETGNDDPDEPMTRIVQLCGECAANSGLAIGVGLVPDEVPVYTEPGTTIH